MIPDLLSLVPKEAYTAVGIVISAILATFGVFVSNRQEQLKSRRQHTLEIHDGYRNTKSFLGLQGRVTQHFLHSPIPVIGDQSDLDPNPTDTMEQDKCADVDELLNHYEFLAGAILNGDIDEDLMKRLEGVRVCRLFERASRYIDKDRVANYQPSMYRNLQILHWRWTIGRSWRVKLSTVEWRGFRALYHNTPMA